MAASSYPEHSPVNMTDLFREIKQVIDPPDWLNLANLVQLMAIATAFFAVTAAAMRLWVALFRKIEVSFVSTIEDTPGNQSLQTSINAGAEEGPPFNGDQFQVLRHC